MSEASWLGTGESAVFTVFHPARGRPADHAVLFCPPFGWGEACSYRDLRAWAEAFAEAGVACGRMWPPGVGDSGGSPRGRELFPAWLDAVGTAARWLRERTGARRLVVVGIGLGGMLACRAAEAGADIDDLVLWGVPAAGRTLLRHERLHAGVVTAISAEPILPELGDGEGLQLIGYRLGAADAAAIGRLALHPETLAGATARRVLLLGRDGLAVDRSLEERFRAAGAEVTVDEGPDWLELVGPPQRTVVPHRTIERTVSWVREVASGASEAGPIRLWRGPAGAAAVVDGAGAVRERVLPLTGELAGCFAIVSEPAERDPAPVTAIWLSPHHAGPSRLWVEIARRWAARGVPTVRLDLMGQGESDGPSPRPLPDTFLYAPERRGQLPALFDQLSELGLPSRFVVGGYCAGAYWALQAGLADPRVRAAMLLNLYVFTYSDDLVAERRDAQSFDEMGNRAWRRLRERRVSAEEVRRGLRTLRLSYGPASRPLERRQRAETERVLDRLRERGIETLLVLCQGESLLAELEDIGSLQRWPNLVLDALPSRDHYLWELRVQDLVHASVDRALERVLVGGLSLSA